MPFDFSSCVFFMDRELDITDCSCVTDEGIKALCIVSVAENSIEGKKKGQELDLITTFQQESLQGN